MCRRPPDIAEQAQAVPTRIPFPFYQLKTGGRHTGLRFEPLDAIRNNGLSRKAGEL